MIAEFGHFCLALAFALAAAQALVPAAGVFAGQQLWMRSAGTFAAGQFVFVLISLACLVTAGSLVCLVQLGLVRGGGGVLDPSGLLALAGLVLANVAGWKLRHQVRRLVRGAQLQREV